MFRLPDFLTGENIMLKMKKNY